MKSYVVTEQNIYAVAGLLKKFLSSCDQKNQYISDYITSHKSINKKYWWDGSYLSKPSPDHVYVRMSNWTDSLVIHIELPVRTDIRIGDKIYFIGGNKVAWKSCLTGKIVNHEAVECKPHYSKFRNVYEREYTKYIEECD